MAFHESLTSFTGLPVVDWSGESPTIDFATTAVRLRLDYEESEEGVSIADKLAALLETPGVGQLRALVIGSWQPDDSSTDSSAIVEALVGARAELPGLRRLFLGDIIGEECEVSWIQQCDLTPLLAAYDRLEHLAVRGSENLTFGPLRHEHLTALVIETGGLPPAVVHEITAARLPALRHLELYLGDPGYNGDATAEDLAPLLSADSFPKLRYLGLRNSVIADEIATAFAAAPVIDRLDVFDLSLGALGDAGARALLASPKIRTLKKLDLHHHYVSDELAGQFARLGIEVDLSDPQEPDEYGGEEQRYISVSE